MKVNRAFFGKEYCIVAIASIFYVTEYEEISKNSLFLEIFLDVLIHPSILFLQSPKIPDQPNFLTLTWYYAKY